VQYTTLDYLSLVAPYLSPCLVSGQSVARIASVAANLPLSSNFGFECKLGSDAPEADFLVAVIESDGSRAAWAGDNPLTCLAEEHCSTPTWKKVRGLLTDWHQGMNGFDPIHDTWLEFDIEPHAARLPEPSFFFGFDDSVAVNYPELAEILVERLLERALSDRRRERLQICYAALPPRALIFQVGVMLSRSTDEVRLCTRGLTPEGIVQYLGQIGWPGQREELSSYLEHLVPLVDAISLDIAVGETILPQIGLECTIKSGAAGRVKLDSLLAALAASAACVPKKREALVCWLGYSTEHTDRPRWPAHLLKASMALGEDVVSSFARTLNHIKITYQPAAPITAKAYLGVRHFWARTDPWADS
jgi:hypothetical protein